MVEPLREDNTAEAEIAGTLAATELLLSGARGRERALRLTLGQRETEARQMWRIVETTRREHLSRDGQRLHPLCAACDAHLAIAESDIPKEKFCPDCNGRGAVAIGADEGGSATECERCSGRGYGENE